MSIVSEVILVTLITVVVMGVTVAQATVLFKKVSEGE